MRIGSLLSILTKDTNEYVKFIFTIIFEKIQPKDEIILDLLLVSSEINPIYGIKVAKDHLLQIIKKLVANIEKVGSYHTEYSMDYIALKLFNLFLKKPEFFKNEEIINLLEHSK